MKNNLTATNERNIGILDIAAGCSIGSMLGATLYGWAVIVGVVSLPSLGMLSGPLGVSVIGAIVGGTMGTIGTLFSALCCAENEEITDIKVILKQHQEQLILLENKIKELETPENQEVIDISDNSINQLDLNSVKIIGNDELHQVENG